MFGGILSLVYSLRYDHGDDIAGYFDNIGFNRMACRAKLRSAVTANAWNIDRMLTVSALHPIIARVYSNNAWYRPGGYRINPYYSGVRMGRAKHIRVTFIWQFEVVYILAPSAQQARVLGAWYGLAHGELSQEYAPFQNVLAWYLAHRRF